LQELPSQKSNGERLQSLGVRTGLTGAESGTSAQFAHPVQPLEETRLHLHSLAAFAGLLAHIGDAIVASAATSAKRRSCIPATPDNGQRAPADPSHLALAAKSAFMRPTCS
jgi:hypothetical protein